jgi:3-methyl-2-oxobutanoate hydroxymethyltransferase
MAAQRRPIAMLTAYDYPTARLAAEAGAHSLLVGDSAANVVLGFETTRAAPLEFLVTVAGAVRRGAPNVFLVGDIPFESMKSPEAAAAAARSFLDVGCDAVKLELAESGAEYVRRLSGDGVATIGHLGLRPQQVLTPADYRAQARDRAGIAALVDAAGALEAAGAAMLLLEAVPNEASQAVVEAVRIPVIGCGAGPACHGHVVVTHDMVGLSFVPLPRFVPRLQDVGSMLKSSLRDYVERVEQGRYPAPEHVYPMRADPSAPPQARGSHRE